MSAATGRRLKIAAVTDIHHGRPSLTKVGPAALGLLEKFVDFANGWGADLVVDLGDRITDRDNATDRGLTADVAAVFQRVSAPRRHMLGNHDLEFMTAAEGEELLGVPMASESFDLNGFHLVFWQADTRVDRQHGFSLPRADLDWLAADLAASELPSIVFTHVPLDAASMAGNYWFEANPEHATYAETPEIRRVISGTGNVVLCLAGHVHWNKANTVDGVPYLSLQSLTESYTTAPEPAAAWSTIEIGEEIHWRCHGADPIELRLPLRRPDRRWAAPLPPFERLRSRRLRRPPAEALAGVRGVLFDLDGVVYRGDEPVPGAAALFDYLARTGRVVGALTNNARRTAADYSAKLASMGITLPPERIVTAGWATGRHLRGLDPAPKVFLAGSAALRAEVLAAGAVESDTPGFVVAGVDLDMTLARLSEAAKHVRAGARLIVSNPDRVLPTPDGLEPEAGAVRSFLEAATGVRATVIGKPQAGIFKAALDRLGLDREETIMVGDTVETDIAGAVAAGLRSVLVESGNPEAGEDIEPTLRLADVAALHERLAAADAAAGGPGADA